jgi:hypothetical protein
MCDLGVYEISAYGLSILVCKTPKMCYLLGYSWHCVLCWDYTDSVEWIILLWLWMKIRKWQVHIIPRGLNLGPGFQWLCSRPHSYPQRQSLRFSLGRKLSGRQNTSAPRGNRSLVKVLLIELSLWSVLFSKERESVFSWQDIYLLSCLSYFLLS